MFRPALSLSRNGAAYGSCIPQEALKGHRREGSGSGCRKEERWTRTQVGWAGGNQRTSGCSEQEGSRDHWTGRVRPSSCAHRSSPAIRFDFSPGCVSHANPHFSYNSTIYGPERCRFIG